MARLQQVAGVISRIEPARNFIDGTFYRRIEFADATGATHAVERVFAVEQIQRLLTVGAQGTFYFWNSHCYAVRFGNTLTEDIAATRRSYFIRDTRILLLMALSIVLLPVTIYIVVKKLVLAGSSQQMQHFLSAIRRDA